MKREYSIKCPKCGNILYSEESILDCFPCPHCRWGKFLDGTGESGYYPDKTYTQKYKGWENVQKPDVPDEVKIKISWR